MVVACSTDIAGFTAHAKAFGALSCILAWWSRGRCESIHICLLSPPRAFVSQAHARLLRSAVLKLDEPTVRAMIREYKADTVMLSISSSKTGRSCFHFDWPAAITTPSRGSPCIRSIQLRHEITSRVCTIHSSVLLSGA